MTEDIREGIETIIKGYEDAEKWSGVITDDLLNFLRENDVAIKVDTSNRINHTVTEGFMSLVESLIKEPDGNKDQE